MFALSAQHRIAIHWINCACSTYFKTTVTAAILWFLLPKLERRESEIFSSIWTIKKYLQQINLCLIVDQKVVQNLPTKHICDDSESEHLIGNRRLFVAGSLQNSFEKGKMLWNPLSSFWMQYQKSNNIQNWFEWIKRNNWDLLGKRWVVGHCNSLLWSKRSCSSENEVMW